MIRMVFSAVFAMASLSVVLAAELAPALVDPYVRVQVALAADKVDTVKADAVAIGAAAGALGDDAKSIVSAATRLEEAANLADARKAFGEVSDALFAYAKATGSSMPEGVKTAYCPMVNKSWLQRGDKIRNPYYGSGMLECGSFR
jgi:Cu(I)/Ag(I) efflux system membrane fusion protein